MNRAESERLVWGLTWEELRMIKCGHRQNVALQGYYSAIAKC